MSLFAANEGKYFLLRKKLDDNGFKNSLSIDSLVLVENLLNKVVALRESLPLGETSNFLHKKNETVNEYQADEYRIENARLRNENNDLNLKLIYKSEDHEEELKTLNEKIRGFETENVDLKFLNGQFVQKTKKLEREAAEKDAFILKLQGKTSRAAIKVTGGGRNQNGNFKQPVMDIDSFLTSTDGSKLIQNSLYRTDRSLLDQVSDPFFANMLNLADNRIFQLEEDCRVAQRKCSQLNEVIKGMNEKFDSRNREIERLQNLLSNGRPIGAVAFDNFKKSYVDKINHLEMQVDCLQEENRELMRNRVTKISSLGAATKPAKHDSNARKSVERKEKSALKNKLSSAPELKERNLSNANHRNDADKNLVKIIEGLQDGDRESKETIERLLSNEKDLMSEIKRLNSLVPPQSDSRRHQKTSSEDNVGASATSKHLRGKENQNTIAKNIEKSSQTIKEKPSDASNSPADISSDVKVVIKKLEEERDFFHMRFDELKELTVSQKSAERPEVPYFQQIIEEKNREFENYKIQQEIELAEMKSHLDSHMILAQNWEGEATERSTKLQSTLAQFEREKLNSNQLKIKLDDALQALRSAKIKLKNVQSEDEMHVKNFEQFQEECDKLNSEVPVLKEKISALTNSVSELDREKDHIQSLLDAKTENVLELQNSLSAKQKELWALKTTVSTLQLENDQAKNLIVSSESSARNLKGQLEHSLHRIKDLSEANDMLQSLNKRFEDDIATLTRENQIVNKELSAKIQERQQLEVQIKDYVTEVKRIEELFAAKDQERNDLLERFLDLTSESNSLKDQVNEQQAQNDSVKMELFSSDSENKYLLDTISHLERQLEESVRSNQRLECEVNQLSHQLRSIDEEFQLAQIDLGKITADLQIERDLNIALQTLKTKQDLGFTETTEKLERTLSLLQKTQNEVAAAKAEITLKDGTIVALEDLLTNKREQEFEAEKLVKHLSEELQLLQSQLQEAENRITNQSEELSAYQTKASALDSETEKLKHQLINERFERERAIQKFLHLRQKKLSKTPKPSIEQPITANTPLKSEVKSFDNNKTTKAGLPVADQHESSGCSTCEVDCILMDPGDQSTLRKPHKHSSTVSPTFSVHSLNLKEGDGKNEPSPRSTIDKALMMKQNGITGKILSDFQIQNMLQKVSSSDSDSSHEQAESSSGLRKHSWKKSNPMPS